MYRSDEFNLFDLLTFHLLLVAVLLEERTPLKVLFWSFATALAWIRLLRLLQLFSRLGPLVLMLVRTRHLILWTRSR